MTRRALLGAGGALTLLASWTAWAQLATLQMGDDGLMTLSDDGLMLPLSEPPSPVTTPAEVEALFADVGFAQPDRLGQKGHRLRHWPMPAPLSQAVDAPMAASSTLRTVRRAQTNGRSRRAFTNTEADEAAYVVRPSAPSADLPPFEVTDLVRFFDLAPQRAELPAPWVQSHQTRTHHLQQAVGEVNLRLRIQTVRCCTDPTQLLQ